MGREVLSTLARLQAGGRNLLLPVMGGGVPIAWLQSRFLAGTTATQALGPQQLLGLQQDCVPQLPDSRWVFQDSWWQLLKFSWEGAHKEN